MRISNAVRSFESNASLVQHSAKIVASPKMFALLSDKLYTDKPLAMQRKEEEIDALRHRIFEDPKTGERTVLMIKDYVVHDIITTNYQGENHPVFFAVTIPQENMARYFPNMLMEGMAYRLTDVTGPEGIAATSTNRIIAAKAAIR